MQNSRTPITVAVQLIKCGRIWHWAQAVTLYSRKRKDEKLEERKSSWVECMHDNIMSRITSQGVSWFSRCFVQPCLTAAFRSAKYWCCMASSALILRCGLHTSRLCITTYEYTRVHTHQLNGYCQHEHELAICPMIFLSQLFQTYASSQESWNSLAPAHQAVTNEFQTIC